MPNPPKTKKKIMTRKAYSDFKKGQDAKNKPKSDNSGGLLGRAMRGMKNRHDLLRDL